MLNYIWAGLIISSLVFALASDGRDLARDVYQNGSPLPIAVHFPDGYQPEARRQSVDVRVEVDRFRQLYATDASLAPSFSGTLVQTQEGQQLQFAKDVPLPEPLHTIRSFTSKRDNDLRGVVDLRGGGGDTLIASAVLFAPVRFVKMSAITTAAFDFAETAVTIALSLIGALALWLGLLRIAEKAGLIHLIVKLVQPIIRPLFPEIPKDHPALGMIVLNLSANVLGLGNAATPLGIKAMEELQTLNPVKDTATNSMVMLLAMNTASVQIVPPVLLVAIMGLQVNQLFFSIFIVTLCSLVVAIVAARFLGRLKGYRESDPTMQQSPPATSGAD